MSDVCTVCFETCSNLPNINYLILLDNGNKANRYFYKETRTYTRPLSGWLTLNVMLQVSISFDYAEQIVKACSTLHHPTVQYAGTIFNHDISKS